MYSPFSASTQHLKIVRKGWFRHIFFLTDGKAIYGQLAYTSFFTKKAVVKTASNSWTFQKKLFSRTIIVTELNGLQTGQLRLKWFSRSVEFKLTNNSAFTFLRKSFWKRSYYWVDTKGNEVLSLKSNFFSRTALNISLEKSLLPDDLILLLTFLGTHLVILKRRRKVAAAVH